MIPDVEKKMLISVQGPVDQISIEPQLPFYFDKSTVTITQKAGVVTYTITASFNTQRVQRTFTVYAGSCPDGYTLVTASVDSKLAWYTLPFVDSALAYKTEQSFCIEGSSFVAHYHGAKDIALMFSKEGSLFYEFVPTNATQHFYPLSVRGRVS